MTVTDGDNVDATSSSLASAESNPSSIELEMQRIELERYKARLDYKKFIWGSVFAAIAIASIPPSFQFTTAYLESIKADKRLVLEQKNT